MLETTIDKAIRFFAEFLNSSWEMASKLLISSDDLDDELLNDWLQANWELLVERQVVNLNEYVEVYGDGADINGASSRITYPLALPNYKVKIKPIVGETLFDFLNNENVKLREAIFEKIVGFYDGYYVLSPDFKYVLIYDENSNTERVLLMEDVKFELQRI
ncbi:hypothetical protein [Dyadobacter sp. 3J3]|uniref:hypothetical protein n=1 Tax=Dyadobacter sp. 3J3 TaxID=2606600 RepID=UPI00135ABE56|nr:hypothetical protein [Dyadobacter sp. 3J3]